MSKRHRIRRADVKADLAALGVSMQPGATMVPVQLPPPGSSANIIALDRVADVDKPDYCTHGYAQCINCLAYCWLGHTTEQVVRRGQALPVCLPCAPVVAAGKAPVGQVQDHLRADGPHA